MILIYCENANRPIYMYVYSGITDSTNDYNKLTKCSLPMLATEH